MQTLAAVSDEKATNDTIGVYNLNIISHRGRSIMLKLLFSFRLLMLLSCRKWGASFVGVGDNQKEQMCVIRPCSLLLTWVENWLDATWLC